MEEVVIFCDGSCGKDKNGGYAAYLIKPKSSLMISGNERNTTNSRMEIKAAIEGIGGLDAPHFIWLVSDSKYVIDCLRKKWYERWDESRKNFDLWEVLIQLNDYHTIMPIWVKGHTKIYYNDLVDREAVKERKKL